MQQNRHINLLILIKCIIFVMKNLLRRDAYFYLKITHCTFPDCIPFSADTNIEVDLYYYV